MLIAIITHYWISRRKYLPEIIKALMAGTVKPDKIVIWNNSGIWLSALPPCQIVDCSDNFDSFARYGAALIAANQRGKSAFSIESEEVYCLFHDDDLTVGSASVEKLLERVKSNNLIIAGAIGCKLGPDPNPYLNNSDVLDGEADVVMRLHMCQLPVVADMCAFVALHGIANVHREDDLVLCLSNLAMGGKNVVVPVEITNLEEYGEGLCYESDHYRLRNECCRWFMGLRK